MSEQNDYQVSARKWRPAEFESIVGQDHVTTTLKNAIRSERVHHAYLFSGPRGVGKTTTARILAKALNCENRGEDLEPCNVCDSCRSIVEGRSMDVVEIDGASNNSVEDVRKLRDNAKYPPVNGRYKLYIIDEVHMLSTSAFNALLKTLEEPPKHLVFVFATTEPHKVPATILSRCQRFDFRRMQIDDIVGRLKYIASQDGVTIDDDALMVIARKADGSMRDSHSIFDQVVSFCGMNVTYDQANDALNLIDQEFFFRVTDMMRSHDPAEAFSIVEQIMRSGYDIQEFLIGLSEHFRNFLTVLSTGSTSLIETARAVRERYGSESQSMQQGDVIRALHLTLAAQQAIRMASQPRLRLELALIQLAVMDSTVALTTLLDKIDGINDARATKSDIERHGATKSDIERHGATKATGTTSRAQVATGATSATEESDSSVSDSVTSDSASTKPDVTPSKADDVGFGGSGATTRASATPSASIGSENRDAASSEVQSKRPSDLIGIESFPTKAPRASGGATSYATGTPVATARVKEANGEASVSPSGAITGMSPAPTIGQIQSRWSEFLKSCDDKQMMTATLETLIPAEVAGGTIRVYVDNEAQRTMLARAGDVLAQRLTLFFHAPLCVEAIVGDAPSIRSDAQSKVKSELMEHPFIKGIADNLGAMPL